MGLFNWGRRMDPALREIETLMQRGYGHAERGRDREAADVWLQAWEKIKARLPAEQYPLRYEDELFSGLSQSLFNWVSDLEMALLNAARDRGPYAQAYVQFCEEALARLVLEGNEGPFRRAHANGQWKLGRHDDAEREMQALIDADPDDAWNYIWWGDFYAMEGPEDPDRAEAIYRRALECPTVREREAVLERLDLVAELRGEKPRPRAPRPVPAGDVVRAGKVGRNDPCPCGSGKKHKKCCLR